MRSAYLLFMLALLLIDIPLRILQSLKNRGARECIKFYMQLRLIFGAMDVGLKNCNMVAMTGSQMILCGVACMAIRSVNQIPVLIIAVYFGWFMYLSNSNSDDGGDGSENLEDLHGVEVEVEFGSSVERFKNIRLDGRMKETDVNLTIFAPLYTRF
ncbi:unnamed protein product [Orchesella dallaii]|uniref:Uncharacterized protein n=1 Tax=Orchesella dallaii TaxID=48710 RepID=A0ABP1RER5_9HEXA